MVSCKRLKSKYQLTRSTGPQKLSLFTPLTIINGSLSNSRWQNRNERPNRYTNNGDMVKKLNVSE